MKKRLTGLFAIVLGIGCACVAAILKEASTAIKICLWVIAALFGIAGAAMLKRESERDDSDISDKERPLPAKYAKKECLMSPPERALMHILEELFGTRFRILPQIALISLVDKLNYTSYRNELFRVVDFVIVSPDFVPLVVVELNDKSHLRADRRERDARVAEILQKASLPLVVLTPDNASDTAFVKRAVGRYLRWQ